MKKISTLVELVFLVYCGQVAIAGGWGPTFAIELSGDGLAKPLEIAEPSILEGLSFWVGPGTGMRDFMAPNGSEKSIVNWSAGVVTDHPAGLQRVEVKFRVGRSSESTAAFFVFIATPTLKTFEATQEAAYWETVFGPIVPGKTAKQSCWPDSREP